MAKTAPTTPDPADVHIGQRLRLRRTFLGVTQEQLAEKLGISFQQIQKYERGQNRISAARLRDVANMLAVTVDFFYQPPDKPPARARGLAETGQDDLSPPPPNLDDLLQRKDVVDLIRSYEKITDPKQRKQLLALVKTMQDGGS